MKAARLAALGLLAPLACGSVGTMRAAPPVALARTKAAPATESAPTATTDLPADVGPACGAGRKLRVHFYDVGQALAALVDLPDGRHVLVDAGDSPQRPGCGDVCATKHQALLDKLRADLGDAPIDLLWITHPHSDHVGGAPGVLSTFKTGAYVDNGRDARKAEVRRAHREAESHGTTVSVADPANLAPPLAAAPGVALTAIAPAAWPPACTHDANACSILLRVDFCASSVLFTGDAEADEEARLGALAPATLLQVGHHGSDTSSTPGLLAKVRPRYAVISAGRQDEGPNAEYCHPRALVVGRLTRLLGGPGGKTLRAFDGARCARAQPGEWIDVPASDRLWATERDGDVVLTTSGDGVFTRE